MSNTNVLVDIEAGNFADKKTFPFGIPSSPVKLSAKKFSALSLAYIIARGKLSNFGFKISAGFIQL